MLDNAHCGRLLYIEKACDVIWVGAYMLNIITEQQSFVNDVGLLNAPWTKLKELILGKLKRVDPDPSYGLLIVLSNLGIVFAAKHGFHPGDKGLGQFHFILQKAV